ncbi:MAG TPA: hypothetical protein DCO72_08020 [Ruminococcus sp.]|nr:hypothetical protein [Ruminococcus sp.]
MKKKGLFALVLSGMMLMGNAISAGAVYESSEEIAFAIRPVDVAENCLYDGTGYEKTIYINQEDIQEGETLHFSVFIEAETQQMDIVELMLETSSEKLTFDADAFVKPTAVYYQSNQTFTLPDGTSFSTTLKPYSLGSVGMNKVYSTNCMFSSGFNETQAAFSMNLMLMPGANHEFLGGQSDLFSFLDLDVKLSPDIEVGTYRIDFAEPTEEKKNPNYVSLDIADHSAGDNSKYIDTVPVLKGCNIRIGKKGDIDGDGQISADDATRILIYSAQSGAGEQAHFSENDSEAEENFMYSLASINGTTPNATDAANILTYAAMLGAGEEPDWNEITAQN